MEAVYCMRVFSQLWDLACGYLLIERFTAIYYILLLVFAFLLGLMVSQMSSCCKEINRFFGEFWRKSANRLIGFCSRSDFGGLCSLKILPFLRGYWKFVKDPKPLSAENSKGAEKIGIERGNWGGCRKKEDNIFMDCRNGNCSHTLLKLKKWVNLGNGFCSRNDVDTVCSSFFLFYGIGFWRLMKNLILWVVENLIGGDKIDVGGGKCDCYQRDRDNGFADCRNRINSRISKTGEEEEEEEKDVFEECEECDFVELGQEYPNVSSYLEHGKERLGVAFADDIMDYVNENFMDTYMMRRFMEEEEDDDGGELEEVEPEDYDGLDIMGLKNALRIERQRRIAAYLELEQERLAATSAVDETMAMIQRLQNEKSLIIMEALQYRYMAEQIQWIIAKHELERSFLQNQLKQCRKRMLQEGLIDERVGEAEEDQDGETLTDCNSNCSSCD